MSRILVVGSANIDLVFRLDQFPRPGETVFGTSFATFPGGKGANQAVAAAKLGAEVTFVARLGEDAFAAVLRDSLSSAGVGLDRVGTVSSSTGTAGILVNAHGQNSIVAVPGANDFVSASDVAAAFDGQSFAVLLTQLEVPLEAVAESGRQARAAGAIGILNPAPAKELEDEILALFDWITPNETECEALCSVRPVDTASCSRACQALRERGAKNVVLTLGEAGCFVSIKDGEEAVVPARQVDPVDTTAAGDAFNGAFACFLSEGLDPVRAAALASEVASLSVTRAGAQPSMPTRQEWEAWSELMG